jgi:chromosome partitioning protein
VGKTTTTLTLGAALSSMGSRVLIMDLDPHACASVHLRFYPEHQEFTVYDIFHTEPGEWDGLWSRLRLKGEGLAFDFVASNIRLSELEMDLKGRQGRGAILRTCLARVADDYDYVVLDCPPHIGVLLVNALVASDLLIIPIQTDFLALHGLKLLFDTVRMLNRVLPAPIEYRALATMYDRRASACNRVLRLLRRKLGERMFEAVVDMDTKFREASAQGKVIFDVAPKGRGATEYMELAREIVAL